MDSDILTAFNQGKHEEAIHAAVKAIDAAPKDPKRYAMLATMLISLKALDQAGELLAKARNLFPTDIELQYTAGLFAYAQADYPAAAAWFAKCRKDKHLKNDATYMLALSYQQAGQTKKALAFALTAHELAPKQTDAALLAADLLLAAQAFDAAADILKPLLDAKQPQILFTYGMALSAAGKDGSRYLDEAKQLDPKGYDQKASAVADINRFLKLQEGHDGQA
ncbi:tetratricopeptide repeat protein [Lacticaseibacillus parahuelsenbergensis]|uniref:Tetratricopeptide repeat protein n=1 Tax=Lacticaseibacillus parahuelsenbergensis TaxID=3068305 RepID=A0ABY9L611_9LACO|nr:MULTISPECIES: tetratricopeptide repeat protein [Lacticaseibacillus]MDE3282274.1 tetratricopeptide repeat protein [Lacticaseibacillus casei]WLV79162.1 tetratricopeptide repeat protein [Lacticaseibacillus sp. NCIMB 15471]